MDSHIHNYSFTLKKNIFNGNIKRKPRNCRTKLQDRFNESENGNFNKGDSSKTNRSVLSAISLNDTRRVLRTGAERISKTFNELRTTIGTLSQRFRISTKRRQILEEGPVTPGCITPHTLSRTVLGRTPTKLYSPFSIDSPYNKPLSNKIR
ncbi:hypothetical protein ILUMI_12722 [Ignelater luminosus]|uniref:Uncharacterized protein n=1 Tax=Ignelater luminosus TaxID=2038154 RepID=A0A8K0CY23_IGNLU|nr:hypothetical protein ILUMI_12722 [Ignelater luminosus]